MSLSCSCDVDGDCDWYYIPAEDFRPLETKRSRRCCSCRAKIRPGEDCLPIHRHRGPQWDIEEAIYGDEVPLATWYMCETCGGLHMSVSDLGFCCDITHPIADQIREYRCEEEAYKLRATNIRSAHHA